MEYITIKKTDLKVSRFCMGGCPMGGYGWGKVEDEDLVRAVQTAVESGVTFFDTADTYGLGKSEILLGEALGSKKNNVVIASKFGVRVENSKTIYDNSPEWIENALSSSLKRLKREYIDLYQIHYRDHTPIEIVVKKLVELKKKGYIRYFGLSNMHESDMEDLKKYGKEFVSIQNEYSLACRKNEKDILNISKELELTPLTWGSLGQGILTGKYGLNTKFGDDDRRSRDVYVNFHGNKLIKNLKIVEEIRKISKESDKSIPAVAIRFILDYIPESVVIAGVKRPEQLNSNIEAFGWELSKKDIEQLDKISC